MDRAGADPTLLSIWFRIAIALADGLGFATHRCYAHCPVTIVKEWGMVQAMVVVLPDHEIGPGRNDQPVN